MKKYIILKLLIFLLIFFVKVAEIFSRPPSNLEIELRKDIEDHQLDNFSQIEAAFILSGVTDPDSLRSYIDWYDTLVKTIKGYNFDPFDETASAAKVFNYLHGVWLKDYKEEATTLLHVKNERRYNCVAGTILFNLVCNDLGWPTEAFETPTHTYTIFSSFSGRVMVENTSSMGFDIMSNLKTYSRYLLQFYPEKQALNIGLDKIYAHENSNGRKISNTELLGLLAYNRAYFAKQKENYESAYNYVLLAQNFNSDSRSNVNFEIDLYYRWGIKLFKEQKYPEAFEVFADAYYRYPDITNFSKNCETSFFNSQIQTWQNKEWHSSLRIIEEMLYLEVLQKTDLNRLEKMLINWANYFYQNRKEQESLQLIAIWDRINPEGRRLEDFKRAIATIKEKN